MNGGAWPFVVGGAICLINFDNERDSFLLNRSITSPETFYVNPFLKVSVAMSNTKESNNRSGMPLDAQRRTRATMNDQACNPWVERTG